VNVQSKIFSGIFLLSLLAITSHSYAMCRLLSSRSCGLLYYALGLLESPLEIEFWRLAVQRPGHTGQSDITRLGELLKNPDLNPNFVATIRTNAHEHETFTPFAGAVLLRNIGTVQAMLKSQRVDVNNGGYSGDNGLLISPLQRVLIDMCHAEQRLKTKLANGQLLHETQRALRSLKEVAQLLYQAGGEAPMLAEDKGLERMLSRN